MSWSWWVKNGGSWVVGCALPFRPILTRKISKRYALLQTSQTQILKDQHFLHKLLKKRNLALNWYLQNKYVLFFFNFFSQTLFFTTLNIFLEILFFSSFFLPVFWIKLILFDLLLVFFAISFFRTTNFFST